MIWTIIPFVDLWDSYTERAAEDVLDQTEPTRLLLINNGSCDEDRAKAEAWVEKQEGQALLWSHVPQLPTLSASWNRALDFVWETGGERAFVPNNDVRLHPKTLALLDEAMSNYHALFTTAVNAGAVPDPYTWDLHSKGGPDFSCFLISKEAHKKYSFDEQLTYTNDCDMHRRYMLGGDSKLIFSVNVPYLHFASRTINRSKEAKQRGGEIANRHREYYSKKWGGPVNGEKFREPFSGVEEEGITNPELQARG